MFNRDFTTLFRTSNFITCGFIVVLSLGTRALCVSVGDGPAGDDPDAYLEMANELLQHQTLGLEHKPTGVSVPTASRAPLYSLLLASVGLGRGFVTYGHAMMVNSLLLALASVMTWLAARAFWPGRTWPALIAGGFVAIDPISVYYSQHISPEALTTCIGALILWRWVVLDRARGRRQAALLGCTLGLAVLARPTFLLLIPLLALAIGWLHRERGLAWARSLVGSGKLSLVFLLTALLVISVWPIRNLITLGRPIVTTSHGGSALALGNCQEMVEVVRRFGVNVIHVSRAAMDRFAMSSQVVREYFQSNNFATPPPIEVEYLADEWLKAEGLRFIREHPEDFLILAWGRLKLTWSVVPPNKLEVGELEPRTASLRVPLTLWYTGLYLLATLAVWCGRGQGGNLALLVAGAALAGVITFFTVIYFGGPRMRVPLAPWFGLIGTIPLVALVDWLSCRRRAGEVRQRSETSGGRPAEPSDASI